VDYQLLRTQTLASQNILEDDVTFNVDLGTLGFTTAGTALWTISTKYDSKFSKFGSSYKHTDDIGNKRPSSKFST
jgi:hemolysin activation/secretion protein